MIILLILTYNVFLKYKFTQICRNFTANFTLFFDYTSNAKEKDYETGFHYYGSRYYSSELSIWNSTDPLADKYPSLTPYNYCANNPVKLIDPNGDTLDICGGIRAQIDILSIVDPSFHNRIFFHNDRVHINKDGLSNEEIEMDAGFSTINNLVQSEFNYQYKVSETDVNGNVVNIQNNSITPHLEVLKNSDFLPTGYEGQVIINPNLKEIPYKGADPIENRASSIFHELEECFQRTDGKHPYYYTNPQNRNQIDSNKKGAHQLAIDKAERLTKSAKSKTGKEGVTWGLLPK